MPRKASLKSPFAKSVRTVGSGRRDVSSRPQVGFGERVPSIRNIWARPTDEPTCFAVTHLRE